LGFGFVFRVLVPFGSGVISAPLQHSLPTASRHTGPRPVDGASKRNMDILGSCRHSPCAVLRAAPENRRRLANRA